MPPPQSLTTLHRLLNTPYSPPGNSGPPTISPAVHLSSRYHVCLTIPRTAWRVGPGGPPSNLLYTGLRLASPSRPARPVFLALSPPSPVGSPDGSEHWVAHAYRYQRYRQISDDARRCLKMPTDILRCLQIPEDN